MASHFYETAILRDYSCPHNCQECNVTHVISDYLNSLVATHGNKNMISWNFQIVQKGDRDCVIIVVEMKDK